MGIDIELENGEILFQIKCFVWLSEWNSIQMNELFP